MMDVSSYNCCVFVHERTLFLGSTLYVARVWRQKEAPRVWRQKEAPPHAQVPKYDERNLTSISWTLVCVEV